MAEIKDRTVASPIVVLAEKLAKAGFEYHLKPGLNRASEIKTKEGISLPPYLYNAIGEIKKLKSSIKKGQTYEEGLDNLLWDTLQLGTKIQNFEGDKIDRAFYGGLLFLSYFLILIVTDAYNFKSWPDETYQNKVAKRIKKILKEPLKHGWMIPPSSAVDEVLLMDKQARTDPQALSQYLCERLKKEDVQEEIEKNWKSNSYFAERWRFLERGFRAHREKDYIASIPILLPQLEGILRDFSRDSGFDISEKFYINDAIGILNRILFKEFGHEMIKGFLKEPLHNAFKTIQEISKPILNRGKILHGELLDYDCEEISAQLIYLIDTVCYLTKGEIKEIRR